MVAKVFLNIKYSSVQQEGPSNNRAQWKKSFKPERLSVNGSLLEVDISSLQGRMSKAHDSRGRRASP